MSRTPDTLPGAGLDCLFKPRAIAIVGASEEISRIGGVPLDYLLRLCPQVPVFPVNPKRETVQGAKAWPSLAAIAQAAPATPLDMAIVAVPAASVPGVVEDAIRAGVRALVIFSSGFAEVDEAGRTAQQALRERAQAGGVRLLGPNCLGMMAVRDHLYASFSPSVQGGEPAAGSIAIVSQSGAFGAYALMLARRRGIGLSYWVTTGNEADIEVADCIGWLATDPGTKVILCYLEGARDGAKLRRAFALACANGKRIVVLKVGRTASGEAAAASHTAALTGSDAVYDALFRQDGVWRAHTIDEFFAIGYAASLASMPVAGRLGVLTVSGGVGALMADEASLCGLALPELPESAQAELRARVPFCGPRNPVDITGQYQNDEGLLDRAIDLMVESGEYDGLAVFMAAVGTSPLYGPRVVQAILAARERHPQVPFALIAPMPDDARRRLEEAGCILLDDPSMAVRALAALCFFSRFGSANQASALDEAPTASAASAPGCAPIAGTAHTPSAADALAAGEAPNEVQALQWLRSAGVPTIDVRLAADADAAVAAADAIGYPVVLKIVSADIAHKTEAGGVRLRLADADAVRAAHAEVRANAVAHAPDARIDGVLVAPMRSGGVEMILGVVRDAVFGPVIVCGLGGVLAEALKDTALRVAPVDDRQAREMIDELRSRVILDGMRGAAPSDIDALACAVVALSRFAIAQRDAIESLDINPFVVLARGEGALALDALIVPRCGGSSPP